jgi:feruloyl esterase
MKTAFTPDANTTVLLVKQFKKGDSLLLTGTPTSTTPTAGNDLCFVKLQVGPGNPGPAGAPSTSAGIGIEVWLPTTANWNQRIHNLGGGGWAGGNQLSLTAIGNTSAASTAATEGSVVGTTDTGHSVSNGTWAMNPDRSINTALWTDFVSRSLHELALKTKAITSAYYLQTQKYAYWDGCSTGGRQGYVVAQNWPDQYDGYLAGAPAQNWTRLTGSQMHNFVVYYRDLGGVPLTSAQANLVGGAAVSACDVVASVHLGYIPDPSSCTYDPTRDATVLCAGTTSNGVTGTNSTSACVTPVQAQAANKVWYGQTADGSVPDPSVDNGWEANLQGNHLWYGLTRGANFAGLAGATNPFSIAPEQVALNFQNPYWASPAFTNATGNGQDGWKTLTYAQNADSYAQGLALQPFFGNLNTDNPDLSGIKTAGKKIISYQGLADILIPEQGSINYYTHMANASGGFQQAQQFDRLFLIPGMGHCAGVGTVNGTSSPAATVNSVPLPQPGQLFTALTNWVENGTVPASITLNSADKSATQLLCPYPQKATYSGSGPVTQATNYACK